MRRDVRGVPDWLQSLSERFQLSRHKPGKTEDASNRRSKAAWWGTTVGAVCFSLLNGAQDWEGVYRSATLIDFATHVGTANPLYVMFLFYPLALLPSRVGGAALVALSMVSIWLTSKLTDANRWLILLSYPALWMIKMGQIDALVMLGAALGWWAVKNGRPYWQGAATLLLCLKPHIGAPLALVYLWWQRDLRAFVVSGAVVLASLLAYGVWPVVWLQKLIGFTQEAAQGGGHFILSANYIGLFPYGLVFFLFPLLPMYHRQERSTAILAASMLASPYAGPYSILAAMAFPLPLWVYGLISLPLLPHIGWWALAGPISVVLYPLVNYLWARLTGKGSIGAVV